MELSAQDYLLSLEFTLKSEDNKDFPIGSYKIIDSVREIGDVKWTANYKLIKK